MKILRLIRISLAVVFWLLLTCFFVDILRLLPVATGWLAKVQFFPALLAVNTAVLLALFVMTGLGGRIYCSLLCPLGVFQDVVSRIAGRFGSKKKRKKRFHYPPPHFVLRYAVLGATVGSVAAGIAFIPALIDPYSAYGRFAVHLFKPIVLLINNLLANITEKTGSYYFLHENIPLTGGYIPLLIASITFSAICVLAALKGRLYCNTICPVGTVLGVMSRFSFFKIRLRPEICTSCKRCQQHCKSGCIDIREKKIDYSRCVMCFNCLSVCSQQGIYFGRKSPELTQEKEQISSAEDIDRSRRQFLFTGAVVLAALPELAAQQSGGKLFFGRNITDQQTKLPVSPAGSGSHQNLHQHCTACHLCVSRCPQKVLRPAVSEYGFLHIMQPLLDFEKGFCGYDCTFCGRICPVGAIRPLTRDEKHRTQIGVAVFDKTHCHVHKRKLSCGLCAENCPTGAILMQPYPNNLFIPTVNPNRCIGCGACAYFCPARPQKALSIYGRKKHREVFSR